MYTAEVAEGKEPHRSADSDDARLTALTRFGTDAVAFQGLESSHRLVVQRRRRRGRRHRRRAALSGHGTLLDRGRPPAGAGRRHGNRGAALCGSGPGPRPPRRVLRRRGAGRLRRLPIAGARPAVGAAPRRVAGDVAAQPQAARAAAPRPRQGRHGAPGRRRRSRAGDAAARPRRAAGGGVARVAAHGGDDVPRRGRALPRAVASSLRGGRAPRPAGAVPVRDPHPARARLAVRGHAARARGAERHDRAGARSGAADDRRSRGVGDAGPDAAGWRDRVVAAGRARRDVAALRLRRPAPLSCPPVAGALVDRLDGLGSRAGAARPDRRAARLRRRPAGPVRHPLDRAPRQRSALGGGLFRSCPGSPCSPRCSSPGTPARWRCHGPPSLAGSSSTSCSPG